MEKKIEDGKEKVEDALDAAGEAVKKVVPGL